MSSAVAETYTNTLYGNHPCQRWWLSERVLIGGSILGADDWSHLRDAYGITAVLNVEIEHSDADKGIATLCELPTFDDGLPKPPMWFVAGAQFGKAALAHPAARLYVHCQMGGSRSPLMGYVILRHVFGCTADKALDAIRVVKPTYGEHPFHKFYLASAEAALLLMAGGPS